MKLMGIRSCPFLFMLSGAASFYSSRVEELRWRPHGLQSPQRLLRGPSQRRPADSCHVSGTRHAALIRHRTPPVFCEWGTRKMIMRSRHLKLKQLEKKTKYSQQPWIKPVCTGALCISRTGSTRLWFVNIWKARFSWEISIFSKLGT